MLGIIILSVTWFHLGKGKVFNSSNAQIIAVFCRHIDPFLPPISLQLHFY